MIVNAITLLTLLRPYFEASALLVIALLLAKTLIRISSRHRLFSQTHLLRISQGFLLASLLIPLGAGLLPSSALFKPAVQVWSGHNRKAEKSYALFSPSLDDKTIEAGPTPHTSWWVDRKSLALLFIFLILGTGVRGALLGRRIYQLHRSLAGVLRLRQIGRVILSVSDSAATPYSVWLFGRAHIVLPTEILSRPSDLQVAIRHEIQHHRNHDTIWALLLESLKVFFFWNPALYSWVKTITQLQEFACDEILIGHRKITPQAYSHCLLWVAQSAVGSRSILVGATGMSASASGYFLKRRIENMFELNTVSSKKWASALILSAVTLLSSIAFASRSAIQDRALTLEQAKALARSVSEGAQIPITVNDLVLAQLNRFVGTPEGRRFVKEGLVRLPQYQALIDRKLAEYGFPKELIAIPLFESGFRNDVVSPPPARAAGIWQFIPSTARNYHLIVNDRIDERLNVEKETDAAMRYYRHLFSLFQDWRLVLKAYNEGESQVQSLIDKHGTRDPWKLERTSTTERYLSGAIAMMIILKNPSLLD